MRYIDRALNEVPAIAKEEYDGLAPTTIFGVDDTTINPAFFEQVSFNLDDFSVLAQRRGLPEATLGSIGILLFTGNHQVRGIKGYVPDDPTSYVVNENNQVVFPLIAVRVPDSAVYTTKTVEKMNSTIRHELSHLGDTDEEFLYHSPERVRRVRDGIAATAMIAAEMAASVSGSHGIAAAGLGAGLVTHAAMRLASHTTTWAPFHQVSMSRLLLSKVDPKERHADMFAKDTADITPFRLNSSLGSTVIH